MANYPLPGYPTQFGNKIYEVFDHKGPKSYANIGTNGGAGDTINAIDLQVGGFDLLQTHFGAYSESGNYIVKVFTGHTTTTPTLAPGLGAAFNKATLQWFTTSAAFGAISTEVTNTTDLSAEVVRLSFLGV